MILGHMIRGSIDAYSFHRLFPFRQGSAIPGTLIAGPDAWQAKDYVGTEKHVYRLTDEDIAELDAAVAAVQAKGVEIKVISAAISQSEH